MYKTKSICWRGPPGSGKRSLLHRELETWASSMHQVYSLRTQPWNAPLQKDVQSSSAEVEDDESDDKALLPMEVSYLHWGFDIARMSLQDKQYVKSILTKWGRGSQVLSDGHVQRCLVLYHAHLLSSESIILLQAFLEENSKDTVLWMTSEHPLPLRLADWCLEIPVASPGYDISLRKIQAESHVKGDHASILHIHDELQSICKEWIANPPTLSDVKRIRLIVYGLLHRNIRWTDGFHLWLFAIDSLPISDATRHAVAIVCMKQPFTGAGQTVPSYRIPILWEHYLCSLRNALAPIELQEKEQEQEQEQEQDQEKQKTQTKEKKPRRKKKV